MKNLKFLVLALGLISTTSPALAHVTLTNGMSSWGSYYEAKLRVPHGCDRADTTALSVAIPEGVISVKPKLMAGWKIETISGAYAKTYSIHGKPVSEGVKSITWSGGTVPDNRYEEFSFLVKLPDDKEVMRIYFPVTQLCGETRVEWNQIPEPGADAHGLKMPAPYVDLMAPHDGMEGMHH
tara:strand:+ start:1257 stop:1799 length:543 start_codon:yes stop_codon:yes gene_type:complete